MKEPAKRGQQPAVQDRDIDGILDSATVYIQDRFIKHFNGKPLSLFSVFDFHSWPDSKRMPDLFRTFGDENVEELISVYSPVLTQDEIDNALDEWLGLKSHVESMKCNHLPVNLAYSRILAASDTLPHLKNILPLVSIMLTISPSTAECERGFSQANRIKTSLRTSLSQDTFSNLMRIRMDGPQLKDFMPRSSVEHWYSSGKGRRHINGHSLSGPRKTSIN